MATIPKHITPAHRLAAIMFTDIVGYTTLMGSDENRGLEILYKNREIHATLIEHYGGTLIKEMGDGMLISFDLASEAVRCAIEIQKACKERSIPLKIGIHEGEMVFEGNDVLGDGVNIASRLEASTQPGCISISGSVYHDIRNKADIKTEFLEEKQFKNVHEKIKVYQVLCGIEFDQTAIGRSTLSNTPQKFSIVVLPFENMSSDPEQEYFSDGLTDEIITDLSFIENLQVISRSSSMTFKGSKKKITEIAREVNVRYVLEGSVRKAGNNIRIMAQLIDAKTDTHIWAEKYNGTLDDIFDFQENVSRSIADVLKIKIGRSTEDKLSERSMANSLVYDLYLKARYEAWQFNEVSISSSEKLLQEGLKIGGDNALMFSELAHINVQYVNNLLKDPESYPQLLQISDQYAKKALSVNPNLAAAHYAQALAIYQTCNPVEAFKSFERGLIVEPNTPESMLYLVLGYMYAATGLDMDRSYELLEIGKRLDPVTTISKTNQGWRLIFTGEFQKMVDQFKEWQLVLEQIKAPASIFFVWWHGLNRDYNESFRIVDWIVAAHPGHIMASLGIFMKYSWQKDKKKALDSVTAKLEKAAWWDDAYSMMMAEGYAVLKEYDLAFKYLNRAIDYGITNIDFLTKYNHFLENLRSDKRFEESLFRAKRILDSLRKARNSI